MEYRVEGVQFLSIGLLHEDYILCYCSFHSHSSDFRVRSPTFSESGTTLLEVIPTLSLNFRPDKLIFAMVKNGVLLALLASLNRVVSAASEDDVVTCVETTGENVITNPSWESGTSGWTYNCTFSEWYICNSLLWSAFICPFSTNFGLHKIDNRQPDYNKHL